MVCIIDDREDVWNFAPNLIHVKPYQFFKGVGDINAPPGSSPPSEEGNTSPGEPMKGVQEGDVKTEEVNSVENEGVEEQENNDAVFEEESRSQENKSETAPEEKTSLENPGKNLEAREETAEPVVDTCIGGNNTMNAIDETVETSKGSSKVLENGENDNANDETKKEELNETKAEQNDQEGEQNNNGKTDVVEEQKLPDCDDKMKCEAAQQMCEGVQTKYKKSQKQSYEFGDGDDDYLLHLEDILHQVHEVFYKTVDSIKPEPTEELQNDPSIAKYCSPGTTTPDLKAIVTELRRDVLRGANVVFTGVIPTSAKPEDSHPWRVACALGARVSNTIVTPKDTNNHSDVTTHVIAGRLGTEKSYRAVKTRGIKLVNPGWLFCCYERWEWVDERLFPLEGLEKYRQQIRDQGTPRGTPRDTAEENVMDLGTGGPVGVVTKTRSNSASSADILMSTLNPLLSFSPSEVEAMDKEVEDLMNASDEESDLIGSVSDSSSSSDSEESEPTSKRKREEEKDDNNESLNKKIKVDDKDEEEDEDDEVEESSQDSSDSDSDNDYTHRSTPSDDDDDMAAMLDAELSHA